MAKDGATEEQINAIRMTPQDKKRIVNEFSSRKASKQITEEISVNRVDSGEETQALLSGDADEELRMQDRLYEKA